MTYDPPTEAEWSEWTASGEARTCCDCGARGHTDEMLVADPHDTPPTYLCERCAVGYRPCDHCDTATPLGDVIDCGTGREYCAECAEAFASEQDHYDWLRRTMP